MYPKEAYFFASLAKFLDNYEPCGWELGLTRTLRLKEGNFEDSRVESTPSFFSPSVTRSVQIFKCERVRVTNVMCICMLYSSHVFKVSTSKNTLILKKKKKKFFLRKIWEFYSKPMISILTNEPKNLNNT